MIPWAIISRHLGVIVVGHVLSADLDQLLVLVCRLLDLFGHFELAPVGQRLFAIDVLAGLEGVDRLLGVQPIGRGDAHDVHGRVVQQLLVLHVHFGSAGGLAGRFQSWAVHIAHGHRLGDALGLQITDDLQMGLGAASRADKSDAEPLVAPRASAARMWNLGAKAAAPAAAAAPRRKPRRDRSTGVLAGGVRDSGMSGLLAVGMGNGGENRGSARVHPPAPAMSRPIATAATVLIHQIEVSCEGPEMVRAGAQHAPWLLSARSRGP